MFPPKFSQESYTLRDDRYRCNSSCPSVATITKFASLYLAKHPQTIMSSSLIHGLLHRYPFLQSEYIQVLIVVVGPLLLVLVALLFDLTFRRRVVVNDKTITFRSSFAVRCAWAFVVIMIAANAVLSLNAKNAAFTVFGSLIALLELVRNFPGNIAVGDDGVKWPTLGRRAFVRWEEVSCFVKQTYAGGTREEEYRLYGMHGEKLVFSRMLRSDYEAIANQIRHQLRSHGITPGALEPQSILDNIHKFLAIIGTAAILYGWYVRA